MHVASAGGVWAGIVHGFAGMVEHGDHLEFTPRLPTSWDGVTFHLRRHGSTLRVDLDHERCTLTVVDGAGVPISDGDELIVVTPDTPVRHPVDLTRRLRACAVQYP